MSVDPEESSSSTSTKATTVLGNVFGWPLYIFGVFPWLLGVIPYVVERARGEPLAHTSQGFAGLGTFAFFVLSGIGLLLIIAANLNMGKTRLVTLSTIYLVVLFVGFVASFE